MCGFYFAAASCKGSHSGYVYVGFHGGTTARSRQLKPIIAHGTSGSASGRDKHCDHCRLWCPRSSLGLDLEREAAAAAGFELSEFLFEGCNFLAALLLKTIMFGCEFV
jgi:hypothetical protein